ncbi:pilus assembly protein CpaE [Frigoribacterium sp. VKM Ac-2836]|uniref:pilus assembly protein CpaE n=1 Tax=Frigoribacterium sp. VKM Ac-2836 TaxID=2739014 RepID=UPI0015638A57|nr:pilus assembly protein CpaE [Frigoribacterium sp. VKM Ac-2836]NRD27876.1 pilus assembly protein CpaE [Frigoribacterium sp. VKM Ac-2836]
MLDHVLARRLRDAGLRWRPRTGDRFVIETPGFDGDVFTLSEMTIEAHEYPTGTVLGFNGTTEWALDSVAADDSLWLPREDQLRDLLGPVFRGLIRHVDDDGGGTVYEVVTRPTGADMDHRHRASGAEDAYAQALLAYIDASLRLDEADAP